MLTIASQLIGTPVMSLQTGTELARTKQPVINPRTLSIVAYEVDGISLDQRPSFLRIPDIRELGDIGMIIDSSDEFVGLNDVIKLKEIYDLQFPLVGLEVVDERGRKLGKVDDYVVEIGNFVIQQLNVRRPLLKSLGDSELLIHRSQIIKTSSSTITVKAPTKEASDPVPTAVKAYVNPFRQPGKAQPEAIRNNKD